jgi:acyl carrier protein
LLEGGFYYYDPREHRLITLSEGGSIEENIHTTVNQLIYDKAAFSIYLVGDLSAITPMYGKKEGLEYMAIEAGIITQLLESTAPNFMIGLCQIGKLEFDCLREKLKLNDNHVFLHCILGGKITENQLSKEGLIEEWNLYERNMENYESKKDYMEKDESKVTIYELIETYLKDKLPSYMVPSKIIVLDSLPLTQNGKVDRRMLTEIGRKQSVKNTRNSVSLPSNEIERKIINIWKDIFPQTEFGIRDNFFDLGGDSVSMVSVFRRLQKEISNKITMVDLFRYPTIEALAQFISSSENLLDGMKEDIIDREAERANARRTILINRAKKLTNTDS